ncbi:MAG: protein kinase [Deltaproteobacteria bacterium]|nr:protein kinase [Deltaproteobacteria bacterium]
MSPASQSVSCQSCAQSNPPVARFCGRCGWALATDVACATCGTSNPVANTFCHACGVPLAGELARRRDLGPTAAADDGPAPPAALPASFAAGRYRVLCFLGEGSRKRVYRAHDERLDRDVAIALIKTAGLDGSGRTRVQREAQAMARLGDHPHIVTVFDIGEEAGQPFIVSQYMAGGSLEGLLRRAPADDSADPAAAAAGTAALPRHLPIEHALRIAGQIAQALEHAHAREVLHRDLKPGNVWLTADGSAKLGDFGLALALDRSRLTQEGMMVGTATYMPPEQALGRSIDARADLYGLGAVLYEMVTGRPPFLGDDAVAVISQHLNTAPVAPSWHNPAVPLDLEALIMQLLAKAPEDRPATASLVFEALAAIERASTTLAGSTAPGLAVNANPLDRMAAGAFVGREAAMHELRAGLEAALSGRGQLLLLVGEPGIGKTRTAEELATYARVRGAQVLIGRCYEGEGAPAYWPWVQVLRSYVQERDPAILRSELGSGAADIAQIVSEVRERLPDLPPPAALEPEQARFRLFDSITAFLKNAANRQPLVVIIDDLHWADKPSLLLLQFLARELSSSRLLVLGTYRDVELRRQHPLSHSLGELAREQLSRRILLRGITAGDVARYLELTAGKVAPAALVNAVYRETDGNPFFVTEIARLLIAEGRLDAEGRDAEWGITIPQSVREVVGRRLDRLSERCNQLLTIASVMGREFSLSALERVSELPAEQLIENLEEAMAARIITELPRAVGRYSFAHALVRETLYGELTTTRRVRLHRQIAAVLEEFYAANPESHMAELAYHFYEAAPGGDVERAIAYATRAAERATALLAHEEAVVHYERALQALELQPPIGGRRRCELLLALGDAQRYAGDFAKAREAFRAAASVARTLGSNESFARAAIGFSEEWVQAGALDQTAIELLEEALATLPDADSALRAQAMARLAAHLYWTEARDRIVAVSQAAVEMAQRVGDPAALARTLSMRQMVLWNPLNVEELLAAANQIMHLAEVGGDQNLRPIGHEWRLLALLQLGDITAADREIETHRRLAKELRLPIHLWLATEWAAMRALLDGRFVEAEGCITEALALGQRLRPEDTYQSYAVQMLILRREQGRIQELEETVQRMVTQYPHLPAWRCALAYLYAELGREAEARAEFERLAANDFAALRPDLLWVISVSLLAEVCALLGDADRAETLYRLLLPYAGRNVIIGGCLVCVGCASHSLSLLAFTRGQLALAFEHMDDALAMHARLKSRPLLAQSQHDYALLLLARSQPGDRERALELAGEALETAQALGMRALVTAVTTLKLRAQGISATDFTTSIDSVASSVQRRRPDLRRHVARDGTVTLMFSDMEGFTQMTERLGDREAHRVIRAHNAIVRRQLAAHDGAELELQGDGFLLAFADPERGLRCAIAIQRAFAGYNERYAQRPIRVRIGLHTGEAIAEADRFFGKTVILAARIAAQAAGDEILVSAALKELISGRCEIAFDGQREVQLKGLSGSYTLHRVNWRTPAAA